MKKGLYANLAWNNIKKNKSTFFPFLIVTIAMVSMFYMMLSISLQSDGLYYGAEYMSQILYLGAIVIGIVSAVIVLYTNSFLMKQRTKEFGLYNVLGMEKRHIGKVIFWEIMIIALSGMVIGIILGMVFSKLLFLLLINMLELDAKIPFKVSPRAIGYTVAVFVATFAVDMVGNRIRIAVLKPVEMLSETNAGEREPKAKWLVALIGVATLAAGYHFAVATKNPLEAMNTFFVAVLLVVVGTYCLFIAGSITLLKLLKQNKKFYYHKTHFVTVSGMMFRMKQNAMGLASICILSTMLIVVLSTTVSLYIGIEDEQRTRYPKDVMIEYDVGENADESTLLNRGEAVRDSAQRHAENKNVTIKKENCYTEYMQMGLLQGNEVVPTGDAKVGYATDLVMLYVMNLDEYNKMADTNIKAGAGENIALVNEDTELKGDSIKVNGTEIPFTQKGKAVSRFSTNYCQEVFILVPDFKTIQSVKETFEGGGKFEKRVISRYVTFDLDGKLADKQAYGKRIKARLSNDKIEGITLVEDYYSTMQESLGLYASVFFIGIFIGIVFLIATVLIIYYKQVSEGYEDSRNFQIMEKIGLSKREINKIINSQIRMVFLLPLIVAGVHICFAFPIIKQIMSMLNLSNTGLFIAGTIGTSLVFVVVYLIVYKITSRVYYRLVEQH